jgi:DNA-binding MarR family transcriptional regulator
MAATARPRTPASEAWDAFQQIMLAQRTRLMAIASEFDLSPPQIWALKALEPGAPRPMSELAGALHCDNSNVTGIVDRLEARGLVARRPGEHDRRVKMLEVTPEGEEVRRRLAARLSEPPDAIAGLPAADQRALRDILRRAVAD